MSSQSTPSHSCLSERRFVTELETLLGYNGSDNSAEKGPATESQDSIQATGNLDPDDTPIDPWSDQEGLPYALPESDQEGLPNALSGLFMPAPRTTGMSEDSCVHQ